MARNSIEVTYKQVDETRIPDVLVEGATLLMDLQQQGLIGEAGKRVRSFGA